MLKRLLALILPLANFLSAAEFKAEKGAFALDGKPFQIRSGEIHYSRVPRAESSGSVPNNRHERGQ